MRKDSCILTPEAPNGEPSRLYKDLLNVAKIPRPLTNMFYASYITSSDMADKMDNAGYKRNPQGQHNYGDFLRFIDYGKIQSEMSSLNLAEKQLGAVDNNGQPVDYQNSKDALDKADKFNDNHKGLTATVIQHGDVYNIIVAEKNANTLSYNADTKARLKTWDVYKQAFNSVGIDIENMPSELSTTFSAYNTDLATQLKNLQMVAIQNMSKKDALILFNIAANSPQVKRLVAEFGSIDNAAQALYDGIKGTGQLTSSQRAKLVAGILEGKKFGGLNLDALQNQVAQTTQNVKNNSPEEAVRDTLHKLNKKYKIGINEIHKVDWKINTLSDAATEAVFVMERKLRELLKAQGDSKEGKRMSSIVNQLTKEIANKKYYSGMLKFLSEASGEVLQIDNMIGNMRQTGTELEKAFDHAKVIQDISKIVTKYYDVIDALANDNLTIDEAITQSDISNIRTSAKKLKSYFDKKMAQIKDFYVESTMTTLLTEILKSPTLPDGQSIANAVKMAMADSSVFDFLYSVGRASNPLIAAMGTVIRNAQDQRNAVLNPISDRIKRATQRLYDSGSTSEFMYEDDGHIISDIDWNLYKNARKAEIKRLYAQGLRDFDLRQAVKDWEEQNTEDRVVDNTNGRTEKVPDHNYRKPFPQLTAAQQEYYDTMMQIKGEIGSLLPAYAQKQYLPPQLRRSMFDALGHAKSAGDILKAIRNKVQNLYTVREDDTDYNSNGIIDGDEYSIMEGNFDDTPLKQIPIFFIKPIGDKDELLKNFSSGLQALAGTAVNYDAMNSVVDVVEFMGDFVKGQTPTEQVRQADIIETGTVRLIKDLRKSGRNSRTDRIVDSFINQYVYGKYRDTRDGKGLNKLVDNIVQYTSFKGLATNVKGAFANYIMGEFQMMIEAGAGEFYGFKDYAWAHSKLFGSAGVTGEIYDALTENRHSKSTLLGTLFDPEQDNFETRSHQKYHKSAFRKLLAHDLSFIGYGSGEYLIHYVNMYSVLHNQKVKLNGKTISLYDAFEVVDRKDGVSELQLKQGVTRLDGSAVTQDYIDQVRRKIAYVNQTCHGSMNKEDKGIIYQKWYGRMAMNFRQWMVEHYSRRFRGAHYDYTLGETREGYWVSVYKALESDKARDIRQQGEKLKSILQFAKDLVTFNARVKTNWANMNDMQKYNCKRALSEFLMLIGLSGLSFALGDPDQHKKDFWRRWWIYQTRRMIMDTEASMPNPKMLSNFVTMMNSPFGGLQTITSFLYIFYGLSNGDLFEDIQSGKHKGENRYFRNLQKYVLPFYKDMEQMQNMDTDDAIFKVFDTTPSNK